MVPIIEIKINGFFRCQSLGNKAMKNCGPANIPTGHMRIESTSEQTDMEKMNLFIFVPYFLLVEPLDDDGNPLS